MSISFRPILPSFLHALVTLVLSVAPRSQITSPAFGINGVKLDRLAPVDMPLRYTGRLYVLAQTNLKPTPFAAQAPATLFVCQNGRTVVSEAFAYVARVPPMGMERSSHE